MKKMNCKDVEILIIDYLDNLLPEEEQKIVATHIETCESCKQMRNETSQMLKKIVEEKEEKPSAALKMNFYQMLEEEKKKIEKPERISKERTITVRRLISIAAQFVIFVAVGVAIGWYSGQKSSQPELAQLNQKIDQLSQQVHYASLNQPTASQRIKVINEINSSEQVDGKMLDALINSMNGDESVNVRLTAIYALADYKHIPKVKDAFIESLSMQNDPLLQVTLINLLVTINDSKVKPALKEIIDNDQIDNQVKEQAKQVLSVQI
jgi:anti-sigma-K factor RskA